jgi:dethiobiotin synthetase
VGRLRGCFVTGTDTGVGKTVVAACLVAALAARGEGVAAFKPAVTGLDEPPSVGWPHDHVLLASLTGQSPEEVAPYRFGPAASPHLAGTVDRSTVVAAARATADAAEVVVIEGVGGLLVPLTAGWSIRDFACEMGLPLVVVARPGLGTINHTLLTLEAARAVELHVAAVVLTPWPAEPDAIELSNRETIAGAGVQVATVPRLPDAGRDELARAGARLPLDRWLG